MNKRERRIAALEMASNAVAGWNYTIDGVNSKDEDLIIGEMQNIADVLRTQATRLENNH